MFKFERDLSFIATELADVAANCSLEVAAHGVAEGAAIEIGPDGAAVFPASRGVGPAAAATGSKRNSSAICSPVCAALLQTHANASVATTSPDALPLLFAGLEGHFRSNASKYAAAAEDRHEAMERLMWDEVTGLWSDLRVSPEALAHTEPTGIPQPSAVPNRCGIPIGRAVSGRYRPRTDLQMGRNVQRGEVLGLSSFTPLWAGAYCYSCDRNASVTRVRRVMDSLLNSGLLQQGGLSTSTARTPEQWDFPNGWAPLNWMTVVAFEQAGVEHGILEAQQLGLEIGRRWLLSGLVGYRTHGYMFEKMDVLGIGKGGQGGEYEPQRGFGW